MRFLKQLFYEIMALCKQKSFLWYIYPKMHLHQFCFAFWLNLFPLQIILLPSGLFSSLQRPCIILFHWSLTFNLLALLTCRLPILQGGTFSFITPTLAILALPKWQCPSQDSPVMLSIDTQNGTRPQLIEDSDEVWMSRMREVCKVVSGGSL